MEWNVTIIYCKLFDFSSTLCTTLSMVISLFKLSNQTFGIMWMFFYFCFSFFTFQKDDKSTNKSFSPSRNIKWKSNQYSWILKRIHMTVATVKIRDSDGKVRFRSSQKWCIWKNFINIFKSICKNKFFQLFSRELANKNQQLHFLYQNTFQEQF